MSAVTVYEVASQSVAAARKRIEALEQENERLRRDHGVPSIRLDEFVSGRTVTDSQLLELRRQERAGKFQAGRLIEATTVDRSGRRISHFLGDTEACWGAFKTPAKHVKAFNL